MNDTTDLLKIKIEKAKRELPLETVNAIDAVDWRAAILEIRRIKGYTFEQLGDLEIETELLLCGLVGIEDYTKELQKRLEITEQAANELANEMNNLVFKKIQEELIKNIERKNIFKKNNTSNTPAPIPTPATNQNVYVIPEKPPIQAMQTEKLEITTTKKEGVHPMLVEKLSGSSQTPIVNTEHSLENLTKASTIPIPQAYSKNTDPYRLSPEE